MGSFEPVVLSEAARGLKTIDWGYNGTMMSFDQFGTFLHLGIYHPMHGVVLLSPFEQFDGRRFFDAAYVRSYRTRPLDYIERSIPGFGLQIEGQPMEATIATKHTDRLLLSYTTQDGVQVRRSVSLEADGSVKQTTVLSTSRSSQHSVPVQLSFGMSLNRASYGQLTEGGPIALPESVNRFRVARDGTSFELHNPNLQTSAEGTFFSDLACFEGITFHDDWQTFRGEPVQCKAAACVKLTPGVAVTMTLSLRLRSDLSVGKLPLCDHLQDPKWNLQDPVALKIIHGNLHYVLGNCTIPTSESSTCVITDHVALPLGWNRDNYWQVRFLMEVSRHVGRIVDPSTAKSYQDKIRSVVQGHLNWVFHDAKRPKRLWHRSYLATGVPKDGPIFQLDQQCYPLIELCDALEYIPDLRDFAQEILHEQTISDILALLSEKRDLQSGLYPTDETPGDDPVVFPFHFSSHLLVWHAFNRLTRLLRILGDTDRLQASQLENLANETWETTRKHFIAINPESQTEMFAYLTDGLGKHVFYHDANDIPTLFAKEWGFCKTGRLEDAWAQTFQFALSPVNVGGFYGDGPFGGLGSVHTRGPWPLGYYQELVFAEMQGDANARCKAWQKIKRTSFSDGLFSEAVDQNTGKCTSKAWFSWPGCMIGSALLQDRAGKVFGLLER